MGGQSGSACTVESGLEAPSGTENELLRVKGARLFIIDAHESLVVHDGDFAFRIVKQNRSTLAAAVATVGDLVWPLGKDSPSLAIGKNRFAFSLPLPGLMYGLTFPFSTPAEALQSLQGLLQQYSAYQELPHISDGIEEGDDDPSSTFFWNAAAPGLEKTIGGICRDDRGDSGSCLDNGIVVSQRMMQRIQRARRMSAVAKLFCKALVRGAIYAGVHVSGCGGGGAAVVARVDAVARVTEAVETAGRGLLAALLNSWDLVQEQVEQKGADTSEDCGGVSQTWTLNKAGLRLLLQATAASAIVHVARAIKESEERSYREQYEFIPMAADSSDVSMEADVEPLSHAQEILFTAQRPAGPFQQYNRATAAEPQPQPLFHYQHM